jgi:hypothetical protein
MSSPPDTVQRLNDLARERRTVAGMVRIQAAR